MEVTKLNDNKAGMEGLDKEKINAIIAENSMGSKFYENEEKKLAIQRRHIAKMLDEVANLTSDDFVKGYAETDKLLTELRNSRRLDRIIVHVDMDAFFAAVEMRDNPSLRNKPMAVGSMGMLSTSNYPARRYGIRAAMPGFIAKKLYPQVVLIPPDFDKYSAVSGEVRRVFARYDPNFSAASLDEAYLDLTEHMSRRITGGISLEDRTVVCRFLCRCALDSEGSSTAPSVRAFGEDGPFPVCPQCLGLKTPTAETESVTLTFDVDLESAVHEMRFRIFCDTQLTASAGIACNGLLAKIASDRKKPNGQFRVDCSSGALVEEFMASLSVRKVPGIGKVSEEKLKALDICTCADILEQRHVLFHVTTPTMLHFYLRVALGVSHGDAEDASEDEDNGCDRKSVSVERTFRDTSDWTELQQRCTALSQNLCEELAQKRILGSCVSVKLKLDTFEVRTRAKSIGIPTRDAAIVAKLAEDLLLRERRAMAPRALTLRLLGVRMSQLVPEETSSGGPRQTTLREALEKMHHRNVAPPPETSVEIEEILISDEESNPDLAAVSRNDTAGFHCPVCSHHVLVADLMSFNRHLDDCLSREAIRSASREACPPAASVGKPEKRSPPKKKSRLSASGKKENNSGPLDRFVSTASTSTGRR